MKHLRRNLLLLVASIALGSSSMNYGAYAQQTTLQPIENLGVFDSRGTRVGNVIGFVGDYPSVSVNIAGKLVILQVRGTKFFGAGLQLGSGNLGLVFESTTCSGTPFVSGEFVEELVSPITIVNNKKLYSVDGSSRTILAASALNDDDPNCIQIGPEQMTATPLRFLLDLATRFQPPFKLAQGPASP